MKKVLTLLFFVAFAFNKVHAATFSSVSSGTWSAPATWSVTGVDADSIPDFDDDVTINGGHTVVLTATASLFKTLTIQTTGVLNAAGKQFKAYGNINNQGSITGNPILYIVKVCTLSSVSQINCSAVYEVSTLNVAAGTTVYAINGINLTNNLSVVNNFGNVISGRIYLNGTSKWFNQVNSTLILNNGFSASLSSTFDASSNNNTVTYRNASAAIFPGPHFNLILTTANTKSITTTLNVLNDLTINTGNVLNANNFDINIGGNFTNNSTFTITNQATVNFNGSTAQSIGGTQASTFKNLSLSNNAGLTVNTNINITDELTINAGNFNSNGRVTLVSDATKTARIAPVVSGGSLSGNMTIQKYISARVAGYHDISSPVQSTTIMDWDDELYMSGIGPYDGVVGPAGVDGSAAGAPSVFTWDETTCNTAPNYGWTAVSGSGTPLVNGSSLEIFIGDDPNNYNGGTLDTRGVPQFGDQTINLSYTASQGAYAGTNLVGNPFASAIDYASCPKTNVTSSILILDNSGNYADYGTNAIIPPHQGFWIYADGPGASITFEENAKSSDLTTTFYRSQQNYGIKLLFSSPSLSYFNENTINFNSNSSEDFDKNLDALYLKSPNKLAPAIYMLTGSDARLITNTINSEKDNVSIPLAIFTPIDATYYIEPNVLSTDNYTYVWLENTKTGEKYDLNSSVSILGEANKTNYDYVLRLSKASNESEISETAFDNSIIVFATENDVNLKSINTKQYISELSIYDLSGKLVLQEKNITVESGELSKIDISTLTKGVYVVNVVDIFGHEKNQKIIR